MNPSPELRQEPRRPESVIEQFEGLSLKELQGKAAALMLELQQARQALDTSQSHVEKLKQENWKLRIDPRTGLEREQRYYEDVNEIIQTLIEQSPLGAFGALLKYFLA